MDPITLPSGNTVTFRPSINNADRRKYVEAMENGPREEITVVVPVKDPATGIPRTDPATGEPLTETRIVKESTWGGAISVGNLVLGLVVESWSFPFPIPRDDPEGIDHALDEMLTIEDYDTLAREAEPMARKFFVSTAPVVVKNEETSALELDPDSPTPPSSV